MRRLILLCSTAAALAFLPTGGNAQWHCLYATYDDPDSNGTGHNTTSVGVIGEDNFVALVMTRGVRNFLVPYKNADSAVGRLYSFGYGSAALTNVFQLWTDDAFDQVSMFNAFKIKATSDGTLYVANNDPEHNILVFKFAADTITAGPLYARMITGSRWIFGLDVDAAGYVYACIDTTSGVTDDIKIYAPASQWTTHSDAPVRTIDLPDGIYKGIAVSPDGGMVFVSDYTNRRILRFTGSRAAGYTQDMAFAFALTDADTVALQTTKPSLLHLAYKSPQNILFAASQSWLGGGGFYDWGRIYLVDPYRGGLASTDSAVSIIDDAKWNFLQTGVYNNRVNGKVPGNASGYTSTYDVAFDANGNLYTQSHFGWTVEKWKFDGTLPTLSPTGVEQIHDAVPSGFSLRPNYPNPFNPATTLEFSLDRAGIVRLVVYDLLGREIARLANGLMSAGTYRARFDASSLPSGVYLARLTSGDRTQIRRMILTK